MMALLLGLLIILIGAELFTNAVEWLGKRLRLSQGVVGSLLAAVGTALPESIIPLTAFAGGGSAAIGVGAIMGAPFMLGTLALCVTGCAACLCRWREQGCRQLTVASGGMLRDLRFVLVMYTLTVVAAFCGRAVQLLLAGCLLLGYGWYVLLLVREHDALSAEGMRPLYLSRSRQPMLAVILVQLAAGLAAIVLGAHYFVGGIDHLAALWHIQPLILALVLSPIATELPEKFNSVIWIAQGKDTLALGNITGAMVFQSAVIPAVGMLLVPWRLDLPALFSSVCLLASLLWLYGGVAAKGAVTVRRLLGCGVFYGAFLFLIIWGMG